MQNTRWARVSLHYTDAVDVFYCPSRLDFMSFKTKLTDNKNERSLFMSFQKLFLSCKQDKFLLYIQDKY